MGNVQTPLRIGQHIEGLTRSVPAFDDWEEPHQPNQRLRNMLLL